MENFKKVILMNKKDSVAMALMPIQKDDEVVVVYNDEVITKLHALEDIELYHKIAVKDILQNETVIKYGEVIGMATVSIKAGQHVHINNIESVMIKNEN